MIGEYVAALRKELSLRHGYLDGEPVETIYFGGGTPSLIAPEDIDMMIRHIRDNFETTGKMEITLEANPDDLTEDYLTRIRQTDVNRISIGIQTFDDRRLRLLGRRNDAQQAIEAVRRCQRHRFDNISIDLIYGFPSETNAEWEKDIDTAIALNVQHISSYHIIYEEGTRLSAMLKQHKIDELDEESSILQFQTLKTRLEAAGYVHYEISNFCKPGMHSKHNTAYWQDKKYLGCGPSAHSYNRQTRQWNVSDLDTYIKEVNGNQPFYDIETLDEETRYNEFVMVSLRTMWGADLNVLEDRFGKRFLDYFNSNAAKHLRDGSLEIEGNTARLTRKGIFVSDAIMSDLMYVD